MVEFGPAVAHGQWLLAEQTWRELKAVYLVLKSFAERLTGHTIKLLTDNRGVMYITHSGSKKEHLQDGAMAVFELCYTHNIKLEVDWIPHTQNEYADLISRIVDYDDGSINPQIFYVWMLAGALIQLIVLLPLITSK